MEVKERGGARTKIGASAATPSNLAREPSAKGTVLSSNEGVTFISKILLTSAVS
jgi:hypothetical protein